MLLEGNEKVPILQIPFTTNYWLVRADGGKYFEDFYSNNYIGISDNEISLNRLSHVQHIAGVAHKHYKMVYSDIYSKWSKQQISQSSKRTYYFIEEMKIGDLVLVPYKKSQEFLLGMIVSDTFEVEEEQLQFKDVTHYPQSPYQKRRSVKWLKIVKRAEISEKMHWILSAHQTIFNLKKYKDYINQLLSPIYFDGANYHVNLLVKKTNSLTNEEWLLFHTFIRDLKVSESDQPVIKSNVQSPGYLNVISGDLTTSLLILAFLLITSDVEIAGFKLRGVIPFVQNFKQKAAEVDKTKTEAEKNRAEIEKIKAETEAQTIENSIRTLDFVERQIEMKKLQEKMKDEEIQKRAERVRNDLKLVPFDAGNAAQQQKQMDTVDDQSEV